MDFQRLREFLSRCSERYYKGNPLITNEQYDMLCGVIKYSELGYKVETGKVRHHYPMYSLKKHFVEDGEPALKGQYKCSESPKLDGAAVSILYVNGEVSHMLTRGDGLYGVDVSDKIAYVHGIPDTIPDDGVVQITGEIVVDKDTPNARNYVSGALNLNDVETFAHDREPMRFVAYSMQPAKYDTYTQDMRWLEQNHIDTVISRTLNFDQYPQDGKVLRVDDNIKFAELGYTAHHPRGAVAVKERKEGQFTRLLDVIWQVGKSGKVTPVAILEPVMIGGARVGRATLNNVNFIKALDLRYGDEVEVIRSGEIIPCIVGKRNLTIDN